jgi:hypothetical protein
MKLDAAAKAFSDGVVGSRVIQDFRLPADYFPAETSWNDFPSLSEMEQRALRGYGFGFPVTSGSTGTPIANTSSAVKRAAFIQANCSAVRYSPSHRIWTAEDIYASHQRRPPGCSLMLVRLPISATELSEPFLMTVGPMATPFQGYPVESAHILKLADSVPRPIIHADDPVPAILHPTTFSAAPTPRDWIFQDETAAPLETLRANGALFTVLTSELLHQTVAIYDSGDFILSRISEQPDIRDWNLAVTAAAGDNSRFGSGASGIALILD